MKINNTYLSFCCFKNIQSQVKKQSCFFTRFHQCSSPRQQKVLSCVIMVNKILEANVYKEPWKKSLSWLIDWFETVLKTLSRQSFKNCNDCFKNSYWVSKEKILVVILRKIRFVKSGHYATGYFVAFLGDIRLTMLTWHMKKKLLPRSYFFYYFKSWNGKIHPFANVNFFQPFDV